MRRIVLPILLLGAIVIAMGVSPSGQFRTRLVELQRQGSCRELPEFGVSTHQGRNPDDVNAALISKIHARVVRLDLPWIDVERNGHYFFDRYDRLIDELRQNRELIIIVLAYGHPDHSAGPGNSAFARPPRTAEQIEAYGKYAQAVAERYHGPEIAYEIWNEPNLDLFWPPSFDAASYARLLEAAASAIREVQPAATIISAGLANENNPAEFVHTLATFGALKNVDGIAFHPYRSDGPENSLYDIAEFEAAAGLNDRPDWLTEWGYSEAWLAREGQDTRKRQAIMIARMMLTAAVAKAKAALVYDLIDDGTNPLDRESSFGLFDYDFKAKLASTSFRTIVDLMSGCDTYEFKADTKRNVIVGEFRRAATTSYVVWNYEPGTTVDFCVSTTHLTPIALKDLFGNRLPLGACHSETGVKLHLSEASGPEFLQLQTNYPK
jgi:Cellulase (glycosyl hydrolase family 5)